MYLGSYQVLPGTYMTQNKTGTYCNCTKKK